MVTTSRVAQRRLYHEGRASEQTGINQKVFLRVFYKRHPGWAHRRTAAIREFRYVPATPCTWKKVGS